jgi:predicted nucleotidyltransferase
MKTKYLTAEEIIKALTKHNDILKKYKVKKIGLFGSYVRGEHKRRSDIDFLVAFDMYAFDRNFKGYSDNFMNLQCALEKLLRRKIDLLTENSISPYIKPYIMKEVQYVETP